ncbi:MAG: phospholipid carrier-dependent glycosyltransferase [Candidatus Velthaea sp.]|jgi:Gpi18-like mannosyltransferase
MSSSASAPAALVKPADSFASSGLLFAILGAGLVVRLIFLPASGFHNDLQAFEAWALTLTEHPLRDFYASTSFADYPPGYFFVLLVIGWIFKGLVAAHVVAPDAYNVLGMLAKLPAIAMDTVNAWLLFTIVGRFAARPVALGAAMLYAFNPAAIYVSAFWGQVDSVSWGLVLAGINSLLSARDDARWGVAKVAAGWVALAVSILMKPQGLFVGLVFLAFAFVPVAADERRRRLTGTALGLGAGCLIAWVTSALFHGTLNPVADCAWLFMRYAFGSAVYPYNSINAFNLYAIKQPFWQPDSQVLTLPLTGIGLGPMLVWGWVLVAGASLLFVGRYLQRRDDRAFLEAAMLVSFGFFILATRMHERYVFGAFLLMMPLIAFGRRYLWASVAVSITLLANLAYSLAYQTAMEAKTPGIDATSLWPLVSGPLSALNTVLFFYLGYLFLGGTAGASVLDGSSLRNRLGTGVAQAYLRARAWFDPREGVTTMRAADWWLALAFTLGSFLLCILWYQLPAERYFDEVYYPRSAEEYLRHAGTAGDLGVFEWTHPPLTKLIIALSMMLFGGVHGLGNTGFGWRFLNIVVGSLTVGVLYVFAKYLTRSRLFASVAAGMLLFDGFHYVQSRIATPEITVSFFSLTTLYAFYRLWIAAQARRRPVAAPPYRTAFIVTMVAGTVLAAVLAYVATNIGPSTAGHEFYNWTLFVSFAYFETAVYLFARVALRRMFAPIAADVTYADGTQLRVTEAQLRGTTPEGTLLEASGSRSKKSDVLATLTDEGSTRTYWRDGNMTYATPPDSADYTVDGGFRVAGVRIDPSDARLWLVGLAVSGGLLAASKWNGLFDFFVVWILTALVAGQRWLRRPALFGNPFGIALDVAIASMVIIGGAIYIASYIPHFLMGHNLVDVVSLQHEMYWYHSTLSATHPYASKWWQWPILQKPISYYYSDVRPPNLRNDPAACCVAEILALPNPLVWWAGLITVPAVALLGWFERNKGYLLLVLAYFLQWLPWIGSPRIAFEYHFYPNLSIIVLANAIILQRLWKWRSAEGPFTLPRIGVGIYLAIVVGLFFYFYPVLAGVHVSWDAWHNRMWFTSWII